MPTPPNPWDFGPDNPPVFGFDQVDPHSTEGGSKPVSLQAGSGPGEGGANYWRDLYMQQANTRRPDIGMSLTNQDQARLEQQRVIQALQQQARGDLNSLAQQQLQRGYGQARAQQSSLGSTMRGQGAGAAMRGIQQGQAGIQRGFAGDQQMLMLQEQQAAQALLAQMLQQQQGQDIGQAGAMSNTTLGSQGLDDAMRQFYVGGALGMDLAATERENAIERAKLGFQDANTALTQQLLNMGAQGAATGVATASNFFGPKQQTGFNTDTLMGSNPNEWKNPYGY